MDKILWSKRELIETSQSAWYNHSIYKVPVQGTVDMTRIRQALHKRLTNQFLNMFGGQTSVSEVKDLGNGFISVETLYHIGN